MRAIPVALLLLTMATPVAAQTMEGVTIGMTESQVRAVMGPATQHFATPEGRLLGVVRPDGSVLAVTVCMRDGSNVVSAISVNRDGDLEAFAARVEEFRTRGLAEPRYGLNRKSGDKPSEVWAEWRFEAYAYKVAFTTSRGKPTVTYALICRCGPAPS